MTIWQPEQQELLKIFFHDLTTPLVGMKGLAGLLAEPLTPDRRDEATKILCVQVENMHDMIERMRDVVNNSDVDIQSPLAVDSTEMAFVCKVAVSSAARTCPEIMDRIHVKIDMDEVITIPDLVRLRRILTNLLTNAIRHTEGSVDVYIRGGHRLLLEVCDRGAGLSRDAEKQGGLGMKIVRDLVSSLDGEATWDARPGGGLIARVVLPVVTP